MIVIVGCVGAGSLLPGTARPPTTIQVTVREPGDDRRGFHDFRVVFCFQRPHKSDSLDNATSDNAPSFCTVISPVSFSLKSATGVDWTIAGRSPSSYLTSWKRNGHRLWQSPRKRRRERLSGWQHRRIQLRFLDMCSGGGAITGRCPADPCTGGMLNRIPTKI